MQRKRTKAAAPTWRAFTALQKNAQLNPQYSGNEPTPLHRPCVRPLRCSKKRTTESTMQWKRTKAVAPTWRAFTALQKNAQLNPQCSGNEPKPLHRPGVRSLRCKKRTTESTMQRKRTKPLHRPGVRSLRCKKNAQLNPQCSGAVNARQVGALALVRFRCIVDSVVRFFATKCTHARSVQRLWFVSAALWIQLCEFFCNAVNARQVGATALVRFRCIVDSVVRFFATQ